MQRDCLSHACFFIMRSAHKPALAFQCRLYSPRSTLVPASANEVAMQGLNLLRLLVQNRIAEFHTELELIPPVVGAAAWQLLCLGGAGL